MARSRMGLACSGVPIDDAAAVMWYRKAAEKCHKDAAHLHISWKKTKKCSSNEDFGGKVFFVTEKQKARRYFL
jgi:TPR repeat protein